MIASQARCPATIDDSFLVVVRLGQATYVFNAKQLIDVDALQRFGNDDLTSLNFER
jgi:hypothetical protein